MRNFTLVLVLLAVATVTKAQPPASPPDRFQLERLHLKAEWTAAVPILHRSDRIELVQVESNDQIFVQTRSGTLMAIDANSGATQWQMRYDNANSQVIPVAVTDRHVIAINTITMYAIQRYTGLIDMMFNLPLAPTSPPVADGDTIYVVMNNQRIASYDLPPQVKMPDRFVVKDPRAVVNDPRQKNAADVVAARNPSPKRNDMALVDNEFVHHDVSLTPDPGQGVGILQRTPSLQTAASMVPPYRGFDLSGKYINRTESLGLVANLRQPYSLIPQGGIYHRTPSVAAIPPSVAAVYERQRLVDTGAKPSLNWYFQATMRLMYAPLITPLRIWSAADGSRVVALLRENRTIQLRSDIPSTTSAAPAQTETTGYFPLADGNLLSVDLTGGGEKSMTVVWRANVGGLMNHKPLPTYDSVYQAGDNSGVARVDRNTGELIWRTESNADMLLAVNKERAYIRNRLGKLVVYDIHRVSDVTTRAAAPLATMDMSGFAIPVVNDKTDRLFFAAESGLLVCMRDLSPTYARPYTIVAPATIAKPAPKVAGIGGLGDPAPAAAPAPKK